LHQNFSSFLAVGATDEKIVKTLVQLKAEIKKLIKLYCNRKLKLGAAAKKLLKLWCN
jgi:hypothetical protein